MEVTLFAGLVISVAFLGESIFGFGGGLIALPLLGLVMDVHDAVTLVLVFQFCLGVLLIKSYTHIDWKAARSMTAGVAGGAIAGTFLLSFASAQFLLIFLSVSIFAFLGKSIFFSGVKLHGGGSYGGPVAGLLGGMYQGFLGTGGPIFIMYLAASTPKKLEMRATLIFLFFVTSIIRVAISAWQGLFTPELVTLALYILPFALASILVGQVVHAKVNDKYYRGALYLILFVSAVTLLAKALV